MRACTVCIDTSNNPSIILPCGHGFCTDCIIQVYNSTIEKSLEKGDENPEQHCPTCRGKLDIKKMIDWNTFKKVHVKEKTAEEEEDAELEAGKRDGLTADALAKLRQDARRNAASKQKCG